MNQELLASLLANCAVEPIQIPGAIQPHGHLLVFDENEIVRYISENFPSPPSHRPVAAVLGCKVASVLGEATADSFRRARRVVDGGPDDDEDGLVIDMGGASFEGYIHDQNGLTLVELEPLVQSTGADSQLLSRTLKRLQRATDLPGLFEVAVNEIRRFTGYDRVVVYHFGENGDGDVLAESRSPEMGSYLGLRFPASDIPAQARELYRKNWMRSIPDVDYEPVPVIGEAGAGELDMSFSTLRSVSPIHRQYMREMGLGASMSVSLIRDGRLWGLLSCGHQTARLLSREIRTACLSIGRLLSLQISALETLHESHMLAASQSGLPPLVALMRASPGEVLAALEQSPHELLHLVRATGVAVVIEEKVARFGCCPSPDEVHDLARWTQEQTTVSGLFETSCLSAVFKPAANYVEVASGVLSITLPKPVPNAILWFRPEVARTVTWAGQPAKAIETTAQGVKLGPRHSFDAWKTTVRGMAEPWTASDLFVAGDLRRSATELDLAGQVARALAAVASRDELVAVVSHDLRSPMTVVSLQASLMLRTFIADDSAASKRLVTAANSIQRSAARMNDLLSDLQDLSAIEQGRFQVEPQTQDVALLFDDTDALLMPLAEAKGIMLTFEAEPDLKVAADPERIYQVLANLIGNAVKFTPRQGAVHVAAQTSADDEWVRISVSDTGDGIDSDTLTHVFERYWLVRDAVSNPTGTGLGLYIARGLVEAHGGKIWASSTPGVGSTFAFTLPKPR